MKKYKISEISDEKPESRINSALIGRVIFDQRICQKSREDHPANFQIYREPRKEENAEKWKSKWRIAIRSIFWKQALEIEVNSQISHLIFDHLR